MCHFNWIFFLFEPKLNGFVLNAMTEKPYGLPVLNKERSEWILKLIFFSMMEVDVDGELRRRVRPYIIDLGSANGTYVNNERIEAQRYLRNIFFFHFFRYVPTQFIFLPFFQACACFPFFFQFISLPFFRSLL